MVAEDPQSPNARDTAGWLLGKLGDSLAAEREFLVEASLLRNPAPAYFGLGQLYADLGEAERALTWYRRAARLSPDNPAIPRARADLYQSQGRFREAVAARKRVIRLNRQDPRSHFDLARTYSMQASQSGAGGDRLSRKARAELRIAFRLGPDPAVAFALGSVHLSLNEPRDAIPVFRRGIELDPKWAANYQGLAQAYEAVGDREAAIQAWQDLLAHAPDPETAARVRDRLRVLRGP
jgi:tetratricopeptide (TPR) repeat protein